MFDEAVRILYLPACAIAVGGLAITAMRGKKAHCLFFGAATACLMFSFMRLMIGSDYDYTIWNYDFWAGYLAFCVYALLVCSLIGLLATSFHRRADFAFAFLAVLVGAAVSGLPEFVAANGILLVPVEWMNVSGWDSILRSQVIPAVVVMAIANCIQYLFACVNRKSPCGVACTTAVTVDELTVKPTCNFGESAQ